MATTSIPRRKPNSITELPLAMRGRRLWHKSAPRRVTHVGAWDAGTTGWVAWREHLASRRRPLPLEKLLAAREPLEWSLADGIGGRRSRDLLGELAKLVDKKRAKGRVVELLNSWMRDTAGQCSHEALGIESLAWCHRLPRLSALLPAELWWELLHHLVETGSASAGLPSHEQSLAYQLVAGELPLTLAYLFPELKPCRRLANAARAALSASVCELLDPLGMILARQLDCLALFMGSWTRVRAMGEQLKASCWNEDAERRFRASAGQALRLLRHDRSQLLSDERANPWPADLVAAALRFAGVAGDRKAARLAAAGRVSGKVAATRKLPDASSQSDAAQYAVLRSSWRADADRLGVDHSTRDVRLEVNSGGEVLFAGVWNFSVASKGEPRSVISPWEPICWVADEDVVYLELEANLTGDLRIQRHLLLARQDRFLLLADSILGRGAVLLEYQAQLPCGRRMTGQPAEETRELRLAGRGGSHLVLPLALAEWRSAPEPGALRFQAPCLELSLAAEGRSLFAPLFIDLNPRRRNKPFTWRQLTVAENLQIQPKDVAVGYRVQIGRRHWLFYRALAGKAGRSLVGVNLWSDLLVSRLDDSGSWERLLEIE